MFTNRVILVAEGDGRNPVDVDQYGLAVTVLHFNESCHNYCYFLYLSFIGTVIVFVPTGVSMPYGPRSIHCPSRDCMLKEVYSLSMALNTLVLFRDTGVPPSRTIERSLKSRRATCSPCSVTVVVSPSTATSLPFIRKGTRDRIAASII